jgi:hypothetical protein
MIAVPALPAADAAGAEAPFRAGRPLSRLSAFCWASAVLPEQRERSGAVRIIDGVKPANARRVDMVLAAPELP